MNQICPPLPNRGQDALGPEQDPSERGRPALEISLCKVDSVSGNPSGYAVTGQNENCCLMSQLTHQNARGEANMVDVSAKGETVRVAVAEARLRMQAGTLAEIFDGGLAKGDAVAVARVAGIQAAKRCAELIPLCHPLPLNRVSIDFEPTPPDQVRISAECRVTGRTGVEMEALTAASIAALTLYDMCKAIDRGMAIEQVRLLRKEGGRSGMWRREETGP